MLKCPSCKKEETILAKPTDEGMFQTPKTTEVCENAGCPLFVDLKRIGAWIIKSRSREGKKTR